MSVGVAVSGREGRDGEREMEVFVVGGHPSNRFGSKLRFDLTTASSPPPPRIFPDDTQIHRETVTSVCLQVIVAMLEVYCVAVWQ